MWANATFCHCQLRRRWHRQRFRHVLTMKTFLTDIISKGHRKWHCLIGCVWLPISVLRCNACIDIATYCWIIANRYTSSEPDAFSKGYSNFAIMHGLKNTKVVVQKFDYYVYRFWATVSKTVHPMLSDRCLSCLWRWCIVAKRLDGSRCHLVMMYASA